MERKGQLHATLDDDSLARGRERFVRLYPKLYIEMKKDIKQTHLVDVPIFQVPEYDMTSIRRIASF